MQVRYTWMALALALLMGCGNNAPNAVAPADFADITHDTYVSPLPANAPVIKVATEGHMSPYSFLDPYGNFMGIDIEVIRAIGEEEGFKVEFYQEPWDKLFGSVTSGQRDLAISGIGYRADRVTKYGISDAYLISPSAIMYKKDSGFSIHSVNDLVGKRVAALEGTKQIDNLKQFGVTDIVPTATAFLMFEALMQDKVDAIIDDEAILRGVALNYPENPILVTAYEDINDPISTQVIMTDKNNTELLHKINQGIAKIKANGKLKAIEEKYLGISTMSQ